MAVEEIFLKLKQISEAVPVVDTFVVSVADKLKTKKEYIVAACIAVPFLMLILMGGAHFIIDLIAYLYPAYASVRAIESDEDKDDDTLWLTYWLVFSLFKIFEGLCESLLQYIPLYLVLKCTFLVWCFHPSFKGATIFYTTFLRPHVMPLLGIVDVHQKKDQ